jgi:hypothetical protein
MATELKPQRVRKEPDSCAPFTGFLIRHFYVRTGSPSRTIPRSHIPRCFCLSLTRKLHPILQVDLAIPRAMGQMILAAAL